MRQFGKFRNSSNGFSSQGLPNQGRAGSFLSVSGGEALDNGLRTAANSELI